MSPTMKLAEFASSLRYSDLSEGAINRAKECVLDAIGCGLGGSSTKEARLMIETFAVHGASEVSQIWATNCRATPYDAALVNGGSVRSQNFDDVHRQAKLHPSSVLIPPALAVAEMQGEVSGKHLIEAIVAGCEVVTRVGMATNPGSARLRGWHVTGICGPFGAAAAASRIISLDAFWTANALGLAGTQSGGLYAFAEQGAMAHRLIAGKAGQNGVMAALLAEKGFTGPTNILEAQDGGFCRAVSDSFELPKITEHLGESYEVERVAFKPYPCCRSIHAPAEGVLAILTRGANAGNIERIVVSTNHVAKKQCDFTSEPQTIVDAQLSMAYIIAVLITKRTLTFRGIERNLRNPKVLSLAKRVETRVDPDIDRLYPEEWPASVEIRLKDGTLLEEYIKAPKGELENPISSEDLRNKFISLASPVIGLEQTNRIIESVSNLEKIDDISGLLECLKVK